MGHMIGDTGWVIPGGTVAAGDQSSSCKKGSYGRHFLQTLLTIHTLTKREAFIISLNLA